METGALHVAKEALDAVCTEVGRASADLERAFHGAEQPARKAAAAALDPKPFLKKAAGEKGLSLEAARPAQPDLLEPAGLILTLGLPGGEFTVFSGADIKRHRGALL